MSWKDKNNPLNYLLRGTMYLNKIKEDKLIPKNVKKNFFDVQNLSDTQYRVFLGPFFNINSLQKAFNDVNVLQFENIEIIKNDKNN